MDLHILVSANGTLAPPSQTVTLTGLKHHLTIDTRRSAARVHRTVAISNMLGPDNRIITVVGRVEELLAGRQGERFGL